MWSGWKLLENQVYISKICQNDSNHFGISYKKDCLIQLTSHTDPQMWYCKLYKFQMNLIFSCWMQSIFLKHVFTTYDEIHHLSFSWYSSNHLLRLHHLVKLVTLMEIIKFIIPTQLKLSWIWLLWPLRWKSSIGLSSLIKFIT